MFALAVGALVGDAILHLLPMVFGAHLHSPGAEHDHDDEDWDYLWKVRACMQPSPHRRDLPYMADFLHLLLPCLQACMVMVGIYSFVMVEILLARFVESQEGHSHSHHHHAVGYGACVQA